MIACNPSWFPNPWRALSYIRLEEGAKARGGSMIAYTRLQASFLFLHGRVSGTEWVRLVETGSLIR